MIPLRNSNQNFKYSPSTFAHKRGSQFRFPRFKPRTPTSLDNPPEFVATPPNSLFNWIDNDTHLPSLPFSLRGLLEMGTTCRGSLSNCKTPMRIQCSSNVTPKFSSHNPYMEVLTSRSQILQASLGKWPGRLSPKPLEVNRFAPAARSKSALGPRWSTRFPCDAKSSSRNSQAACTTCLTTHTIIMGCANLRVQSSRRVLVAELAHTLPLPCKNHNTVLLLRCCS